MSAFTLWRPKAAIQLTTPLRTLTATKLCSLSLGMRTPRSLTGQSLLASVIAAYVGVLASLVVSLIWRVQTGADARICPPESQSLRDWCSIGELSLALFLNLFWALFGVPFALVLTAPCAWGLGRFAPRLERQFESRELAAIQYGLAAIIGMIAGLLLQVVVAGLLSALSGVWIFRRVRYALKL